MPRLGRLIVGGVCLAALGAQTRPGYAVDLVHDGKPVAAIVIPSHPLPVEAYAAQELEYHVRASTGAQLPIISEDSHPPAGVRARVYLGHCSAARSIGIVPSALPGNSYLVSSMGADLYIVGQDSDGDALAGRTHAGTLFAVYDLLESQMGVRWLWPGKLGEVIPSHRDLSLTPSDEVVQPLLWFKEWRSSYSRQEKTDADRFSRDQAVWLRRQRFGDSVLPDYGHSFGGWWDKYGKTHPEYFAVRPDGKRPDDEAPYIHMSVSEPGLWAQIIENWKERGAPQFLNICENDGYAGCSCDKCLAWDEPDPDHPGMRLPWNGPDKHPIPFDRRLEAAKEALAHGSDEWMLELGSLSDRYARFWRIMSEHATKVRPDAVVVTYIYDNYRKPPVKATLNAHVLGGVVPDAGFPYGKEQSEVFQRDWEGWSKTGCLLFLRPNYTLQGHNFPVFYARVLGADLEFAAAHSMRGADFDSLTGQYATQGPTLYMLATVLNHPNTSVDGVLDEFYSAFGPAKEAVARYFAHWEAVNSHWSADSFSDLLRDKRKMGANDDYHAFHVVAPAIFTPEVMAKGWELLRKAQAQAAGDPTAAARVQWLVDGLTQVDLVLAAEKAYAHAVETGEATALKTAHRKLEGFREQHWRDCISDFGWLSSMEDKRWGKFLDR
jgi:hypothetical protein